jgi:hypothetical protein
MSGLSMLICTGTKGRRYLTKGGKRDHDSSVAWPPKRVKSAHEADRRYREVGCQEPITGDLAKNVAENFWSPDTIEMNEVSQNGQQRRSDDMESPTKQNSSATPQTFIAHSCFLPVVASSSAIFLQPSNKTPHSVATLSRIGPHVVHRR